jgi:hypothetical protein
MMVKMMMMVNMMPVREKKVRLITRKEKRNKDRSDAWGYPKNKDGCKDFLNSTDTL